jgi:hypothetical protein
MNVKLVLMGLLIFSALLFTSCSSGSTASYWACMDGCSEMQDICADEFNFTATYDRQVVCDAWCADVYFIEVTP